MMRTRTDIVARRAAVEARYEREQRLYDQQRTEDVPAALSFVDGELSGLSTALETDPTHLAHVVAADRALFRRTLTNYVDVAELGAEELVAHVASQLVDLDELPEADDDPSVNFLYGRLAALEWATS